MPIISKETAQRHLDMWLEAEAAVSTGQSDPRQSETDPGEHHLLGKESGRGRSGRTRAGQEPDLSLLPA